MGAADLHSVSLDTGRDRAPATRPVQYQGSGEVANPTSGAQTGGYMASNARIEVLESGREGAARVEFLDIEPHAEYLVQCVKRELGIQGTDVLPSEAVVVLLDTVEE